MYPRDVNEKVKLQLPCVTVPPAPTNLKLVRVSTTAIKASWTPPDFPDIGGYRIYYNTRATNNIDDWSSEEIGK